MLVLNESVTQPHLGLGWRVFSAPEQIISDRSDTETFGAARSWVTGGEFQLDITTEAIMAVLIVEGDSTFIVDDRELRLKPNELVLLSGTSRALQRFEEAVISFAWWFRPTVLAGAVFENMLGRAVYTVQAGRDAVVSASNALLNAGPVVPSPAAQAYGLALEHLVAAMLLGDQGSTGLSTRRGDELLLAAQTVVEQRFRDPAFNVNSLVRELHTSGPTLHRSYQRLGTTPRAEIERRRLAEAMSFLEGVEAPSLMTLRAATEACGFSSLRHLRRALQRHDSEQAGVRARQPPVETEHDTAGDAIPRTSQINEPNLISP